LHHDAFAFVLMIFVCWFRGLIFMIVLIVLLLIAGLGFIGYMYWRLYTVQTAKARAAYDNLKTNRDASGNIQIHV